jgi:predicted amidohydrolase
MFDVITKLEATQIRISGNMEQNYPKSLCYIRKAVAEGAKFVCFPESQLRVC